MNYKISAERDFYAIDKCEVINGVEICKRLPDTFRTFKSAQECVDRLIEQDFQLGDNVNHPAHYTFGKVECIDAIESALTPEEFRGYLKGNIIKYIWRERHKEGSSLDKALWYLKRLTCKDD